MADRALMPEASVHENSYLPSRIAYVGTARGLPPIQPVSRIPSFTQRLANDEFGLGAFALIALHGPDHSIVERRLHWMVQHDLYAPEGMHVIGRPSLSVDS